jgi:hypothetical protein
MKWSRRYLVLGLALVLTLGVGCITSEGAPTEAPLAPSEGLLESDVVSSGGTLTGVSPTDPTRIVQLLTCEAQPYVVAEKTIGPEGGSLTIGKHKLEIPRGALASTVRITGEQVTGSINSVRLSPEGLRFAKPVRLVLSYRNCVGISLLKRLAYTDELLKVLELPSSEDYPKYDYVTGSIDHFSRYAVAY